MDATQFYSGISQKEVLVREPCGTCSGNGEAFNKRRDKVVRCWVCKGRGTVAKWVKMADFAGLIREEEEKLQ